MHASLLTKIRNKLLIKRCRQHEPSTLGNKTQIKPNSLPGATNKKLSGCKVKVIY